MKSSTARKKDIVLMLTAVIVLILAAVIIISKTQSNNNASNTENIDEYTIKAAVVYDSSYSDTQYLATYSQLEQSFISNVSVAKEDINKKAKVNFDQYDILYLDDSIIVNPKIKKHIIKFVEDGNSVFVSNGLANYFNPDFFGAKEVVKLNSIPTDLSYPTVAKDAVGIQEIIKDYHTAYKEYKDIDWLSGLDYGYGFVNDTAESIADYNGLSLYGINHYGNGNVFYVNPLLPDAFHINGFDMQKTNERQLSFCHCAATSNQIILGEFAGYISKLKYGFAMKKVLGSFGTPDMAWQLHYEEMTGFANNSGVRFGEICKQYDTIPSYTLIRNTYKWFSKFESVTYLLNEDGKYNIDMNENAYSNGTHVIEEDSNLSIVEKENTGSYFVDTYDYRQVAYPSVGDFNNDGSADIICGSSDGHFYYYEGYEYNDIWKVHKRITLTDTNENELSVGSYSAPVVVDYNNDGIYDIISGNSDGEILLFKGYDKTHFYPAETLITDLGIEKSMPYAADINGDGQTDLVVGSVNFKILLFINDNGEFTLDNEITCKDESFVAPFVYDYDNDGALDIIYGTFHGYIGKLHNDLNGAYVFDGYFETKEMNYKGNNYIKFGNDAVPRLFDINNDGKDDLIAGELEYGLPIGIDSPYFKYKDELQSQVDYMKDNHFYLGVHFYTNQFASKEREIEELRLHKKAFDAYGIDYSDVGVNMHTWRVSDFSPTQTIDVANESGFKWMSAFESANSIATIDSSSEFSIIAPFFLDFENRDMLVANASVLGMAYDKLSYVYPKYDLPIMRYYHCDLMYRDEGAARDAAEKLSNFKKENGYNFVCEDQLMKASAAAYNMGLSVQKTESDVLKISSEGIDKDFELYDTNYQECVGIKIEFADSVDISNAKIKADVWKYDEPNKALYVGLNKEILLDIKGTSEDGETIVSDKSHIVSVNIPAKIDVEDGKMILKFEDDGMMQISVLGKIEVLSDGWSAKEENGVTTLTKFGDATELEIIINE